MNIKTLKNAAVYPYNCHFTPLLRYPPFPWEGLRLFSPKAWALHEKDASEADGGNPTGITVISNIGSIDQSDCLIVPEYNHEDILDQNVSQIISRFIENKKPVYYLSDNKSFLPKQIQQQLAASTNEKISPPVSQLKKQDPLKSINVPVIAIAGLHYDLNKTDILLSLNHSLCMHGYKSSVITCEKTALLCDFNTYPDDILNQKLPYVESILRFNAYVKNLEIQNNPEVIIVSILGGILPYADILHNDFGYMSQLVFNAIAPDFCILSVPCSHINDQYLDLLKNIMYYRFGTPIECFYYSNKGIDTKMYTKSELINPTIFSKGDFLERWQKYAAPISDAYNIYNFSLPNHQKTFGEFIIKRLKGE